MLTAKKSKEDLTKFKLKKVELSKFELNEPDDRKDFKFFGFEIKIETQFDDEKKWMRIIVSITITDSENEYNLGFLSTSNVFEIDDYDEIITVKNDQLKDNLIGSLCAVSVSMARGIMCSQFKGTFLQNALLPLIDIKKMIPKISILSTMH